MKNTEFILKLADLCNCKTCYATGAFGAVVNLYNNRSRYASNTTNKKVKAAIESAKDGTFLFDCINLGKSLLWDFSFNETMRYGGANYKNHDIPDFSIKNIKKYGETSEDFSKIEVGEWLVNEDESHVGYYIGGGMYIDISQTNPDYKVLVHESLNDRNWKYHTKIQWLDYEPAYSTIKCPHCGKDIKIYPTK